MKKQIAALLGTLLLAAVGVAQTQVETQTQTTKSTQPQVAQPQAQPQQVAQPTTTSSNSAATVTTTTEQTYATKSSLDNQKKQIDQQYKAAKAKCNGLKENAEDICTAEADGLKKIAEAQMEVTQRDTPKARMKLAEAKADAQYKVAKEKCDDQVGDLKDSCQKEAKAARESALASAKAESQKPMDKASTQSTFKTSTPSVSGQNRQPSSITVDQPAVHNEVQTNEQVIEQQKVNTDSQTH